MLVKLIAPTCFVLAVAWFGSSPSYEPAITALSFLGASIAQEFYFGLRFLSRSQVDSRIGSLEERLENAKASVAISGNDCKFVVEASSHAIDSLLNRGVRLRLLLVDPESQVPEMLAKFDPRFETPEQVRTSLVEVTARLRLWQERFPTLFEYRFLPIVPALGFFIVDPDTWRGCVKIEVYTAKPWKPIATRPHLILSRLNPIWRTYFLAQWENYWGIARAAAAQPVAPGDAAR